MRLKKDKSGDTVGRPSWRSSLSGDPGAKFFCGKPQHMKNSLNFANTCLKVIDTRRRALAVEIIFLAPVLRIALFSFYPNYPHAWYLLMPCRADSLFFGVLGAILLGDSGWRMRIQQNRRLLCGLIVLLAVGVPFVTQTQLAARGLIMVSIMFSWLAAFYLLVLIYTVTFSESHVTRILNWCWLRRLGVVAYGVYLLHEEILDIGLRVASFSLKTIAVPIYVIVALLCLTVTFLLAYLSWEKFEKPIVTFSHRYKYERF